MVPAFGGRFRGGISSTLAVLLLATMNTTTSKGPQHVAVALRLVMIRFIAVIVLTKK